MKNCKLTAGLHKSSLGNCILHITEATRKGALAKQAEASCLVLETPSILSSFLGTRPSSFSFSHSHCNFPFGFFPQFTFLFSFSFGLCLHLIQLLSWRRHLFSRPPISSLSQWPYICPPTVTWALHLSDLTFYTPFLCFRGSLSLQTQHIQRSTHTLFSTKHAPFPLTPSMRIENSGSPSLIHYLPFFDPLLSLSPVSSSLLHRNISSFPVQLPPSSTQLSTTVSPPLHSFLPPWERPPLNINSIILQIFPKELSWALTLWNHPDTLLSQWVFRRCSEQSLRSQQEERKAPGRQGDPPCLLCPRQLWFYVSQVGYVFSSDEGLKTVLPPVSAPTGGRPACRGTTTGSALLLNPAQVTGRANSSIRKFC